MPGLRLLTSCIKPTAQLVRLDIIKQTPIQTNLDMGLCQLPTELQHHIVLNLHPSAAIALRQTNRWFHTHISLHRLDPVAVRNYLYQLELRPKRQDDYACFYCLCLKPRTVFTSAQLERRPKVDKYGNVHSGRFCLDCGIGNRKLIPYSVLTMGGDESTPKVFCGACSSVQSYFCRTCHCCSGCLTRARTWTGRAVLWQQSGTQKICPQHF